MHTVLAGIKADSSLSSLCICVCVMCKCVCMFTYV